MCRALNVCFPLSKPTWNSPSRPHAPCSLPVNTYLSSETSLRRHLTEEAPLITSPQPRAPTAPRPHEAPSITTPSLCPSQHLSLGCAISGAESAQIPAVRPGQLGTKSRALSASPETVLGQSRRHQPERQHRQACACGMAGFCRCHVWSC